MKKTYRYRCRGCLKWKTTSDKKASDDALCAECRRKGGPDQDSLFEKVDKTITI